MKFFLRELSEKFQRFFAPPVFSGEAEKTRLAALLHANLLVCTLAMLILILGSLIGRNVQPRGILIMVLALTSIMALQIPLRRGAVRQASLCLVALITASVTAFIYFNGTVRTPGGVIYLVLASLLAGLLINRRAAFLSAVLNCFLFFTLLVAEINGWLPPPIFSVSITQGIAFAVGALWTVILVNQATRSIDESLALAQHELSAHLRADERARYRSTILENVVRLGKTVTEVTDYQTTLLRIWKGIRKKLDFDRVAIFLYNPVENTMDGAYGTDRAGNLAEIWEMKFSLTPNDPFFQLLSQRDGLRFTRDFASEVEHPPSAAMVGVKEHVSIAVWAGDKPVAVITADQLVTQRPITEVQLEALRLFVGYAGLAIQNARLIEREHFRQVMLEKVIRLGKLVTEETGYRAVLLRIFNSVRDELGFDRLGLFIYDPKREVMRGSFGTDRSGKITEEWDLEIPLTGSNVFATLISTPNDYYFTTDYEKEINPPANDMMSGVKHYAAVSAWTNDQPVAIMSVDQLISGRQITEEQLEALRLFAGYVGLAIENARLNQHEHSRQVMLEKVIHLGKLVTEEADYRAALLQIYNSVRDELGFDRLGLFVYEPESGTMIGSYGTDRDGNLIEEWDLKIPLDGNDFFSKIFSRPDGYFFSKDYEQDLAFSSGTPMAGVKYFAAVSAWAGDKPVAIICVDQLVSGRRITEEQLEALRLFAGYAGLAIENARLGKRERSRQEMLEKVIHLGKLVTETTGFQTTLLRICGGVKNDLGFDRIGLFLYNPTDGTMVGAYGTDRAGNLFEASQVKFELKEHEPFYNLLSNPEGFYFTRDYQGEQQLSPDNEMSTVKDYAAVAVRVGDKPVAILSVDQLLTGRVITAEQLEGLRLFAGYAGLAIENARLNSDLEQRVHQRTAQLEAANKDLEAFSYSVSHDLRAPLRAINGFSKILTDDFSDEFSPPARGFLEKISASGAKMGHLIDDLLALSRLGRKPLAFQPVNLNAVVQSVLETLALETTDRRIEWVISELPPANVDSVLIQQVYFNLIGNALKYSRKREQAQIEISSLNQDGELIYFVRDNGAGFEMRFADRLFGVFQRLHREDEFEGTGIGLAIVQRIIQRHGGRVWAEAEVNRGATFYFTIGDR